MALHTHGKCAIAIAVLPGRQDKHTRQLADVPVPTVTDVQSTKSLISRAARKVRLVTREIGCADVVNSPWLTVSAGSLILGTHGAQLTRSRSTTA